MNRLDWLYAGSAAGALGAGGLGLWLWSRWHRNPEEVERRRREHVNRIGRIAEAEILEVVELEAAAPRKKGLILFRRSNRAAVPQSIRRLILYGYTISGVRYETAQELFGTSATLPLPELGDVASIKYDPARPGNSILVAERWSGLRRRGPSEARPGKGR